MIFFKKDKSFSPPKTKNILPAYSQYHCMPRTVQNIKCLFKTIRKKIFCYCFKNIYGYT